MISPSDMYGMSFLKRRAMLKLLAKGTRLDGREFHEYRPVKINIGVVEKASGSAEVSIGNTVVIAGVKWDIGEPFPDTPDEGVLVTMAEFLPTSASFIEPGPPDEHAIELARVTDRGIRHAPLIDLKKLCLIPGKKVLTVFVDIYSENYDGNLFDAASRAAVASILTCKIPSFKVGEDENIEVDEEQLKPMPIVKVPISVTLVNIGDYILVDPTFEEEQVSDVRLTFTFTEDDKICAIQKGGPGGISEDLLMEAVDIAFKVSKEQRKLLMGAVKNAQKENDT
ncbi:hypothetical protein DRO02_00100 [archaeon]|nr:MAG: hypothetical protein DRO21_00955 [archaeon]RLG66079.1 MAG: hypothetical protein DRO02_00100 [archaeon]HDM23375.1 exosome complex protein Rrp42 [Candidatus Bathyarchaeota archaeon]